MEQSIKSKVSPYGVYMGAALALITILAYSLNLDFFTKWWYSLLNFFVVLLVSILAVKEVKKSKASGITFKEAFTAYFIPVAIGTFLSGLVSFLIFNVIDTEAAQYVMEKSIEVTESRLKGIGTPQEEIGERIAQLKSDNQFSASNYITGYIFWLGFYALTGLIIALIFRDKHSNNA